MKTHSSHFQGFLRDSNYTVGTIYQLKTTVTIFFFFLKVQFQKLLPCRSETALVVFEALQY